MGALFRSEEMSLCQLYLQSEAAYTCVSELGELGLVQFRDLNADVNSFQRKFVNEIQRCEEMERQLRYFGRELRKEGIPIYDPGSEPEAPAPRDMIDLEATYESHEGELKTLGSSLDALESNHRGLKELKCVLQHAEVFFLESGLNIANATDASETLQGSHHVGIELEPMSAEYRAAHPRIYLSFVAGMIESGRVQGFTRLLWFACRGNVFLRSMDIPELSVDGVRRAVFVVFFQGDQLKEKVKKICDGFKATMYPCPETRAERNDLMAGLTRRIHEIDLVTEKSREQWLRVLESIAQNLHHWNIKVLKIKAIYHTMNMLSTEGSNYIAECWMPVSDIGSVQLLMNRATERSGTTAPSLLHPVYSKDLPTHHPTNKFTAAFQQIIDAYGIGSYREVNPAPFSIITFPFLFSVMFGDAGHGFLVMLIGLFLVLRERHLVELSRTNEIFGIMYGGRYIILLMGIFSIYSGLLYNDVFSKSLNIFQSSWSPPNGTFMTKDVMLDPTKTYNDSPYPFGFDPVWQLSKNKLLFTNSFKKKISVILGVSQMVLGVCLSLVNHIHFRQTINILCDFVPQIIFMLVIFGYLCVCIVAKWIMYTARQAGDAPNLLIDFINMFLMSYPSEPASIATWYSGQKPLQIFFILLALICAVWMLFGKPLILWLRRRRQYSYVLHVDAGSINQDPETDSGTMLSSDSSQNSQSAMLGDAADTVQTDIGEVFIQQAIHAIEYCLGCVSHTASYLRLWALSLAHAELSEVLWGMVFQKGLNVRGPVGSVAIFLVFIPFALLTVSILLTMEGLSAFLHTLRLHWVEFQSKFYKGEGVSFIPFSFRTLLDDRNDVTCV